MNKILTLVSLLLIGLLLTGCQQSNAFHTLSFMSNGGSLVSPVYAQNGTLVREPQEPSKENYEFNGWYSDEDLLSPVVFPVTVTQNLTIYAKWISLELETYQITWIVDGEVYTSEVSRGSFPIYSGPAISKLSSDEEDFVFYGWTPTLQVATEDKTYTAQFQEITRYYLITFVINENQFVEKYAYGQMPSYDETPQKAATFQYTYEFSGWDKTISAVTQNQIYVAQFSAVQNEFTVTWDINGTLTYEGYKYGEIPTYKENKPSKLSTNEYSYTYDGWSPLIVPVTQNVVYTALFIQNPRLYTVEWKNHDGILLETDYVSYNDVPQYNSSVPTKSSTNQYDFNFSGWSPLVDNIVENTVFIATYSDVLRSYDISFVVNNIATTVSYNYGEIPQFETPTKTGSIEYSYEFSNWVPNIVSVKNDATYTAHFNEILNEYSISFESNGGSSVDSQTKSYGSLLLMPSNPTFDGYLFDAWYIDDTFQTKWDFSVDLVNGIINTLYANWMTTYEYQVVNNGIIITKYNDNSITDLVIPDSIDGYVVIGLADYSLKDHNEILTLKFTTPENIEYIGIGALSGNNSLYKVELPFIGSSVNAVGEEALFGYIFGKEYYLLSSKAKQYYNDTEFVEYHVPFTLQEVHILSDNDIQYGAFSNLFRVNKLVLNDGIRIIEKRAFMNMNSLTELSIPNSATTIANEALHGLGYLEHITIPLIDSFIGPKFGTTVYSNSYEAKTYQIPKNLKEIEIIDATHVAASSFDSFKHVNKLVLPMSLEYIVGAALNGMSELQSLTIPFIGHTRTSTSTHAYFGYIFGSDVYTGGYNANNLYLPQALEEVILTDTTKIGTFAFYNASYIKALILPEDLTTIESNAFRGMSGITSIDLPESLEYIGDSAFLSMTELESLVVPNAVTYIGASAFANLPKLSSISIPFVGQSRTATLSSAHFGYTFGSANYLDTYLANGYYLPTVLTEVTITDTSSIPINAFTGATSLSLINLSNDITSIGNYAFQNTGLTEILLPDNLTTIGTSAFQGTSLIEISIPSTVNTISGHAFRDITTLEKVIFEMGSELTTISEYTFYGSTSLTNMNIPDSVTMIHQYAFFQSGITNINLPNSLTSIGLNAFYQSKIVEITIPNNVSIIANQAFMYNELLERVFFGENSQLTSIGNYAFAHSGNIVEIAIPNSVITIGSYAFQNLISITTLAVPDSVTSIGHSAFSGMIALESISLPFAGYSRTSTSTLGYFGYVFGTAPYVGGYSANGYYIPSTLTDVTLTYPSTVVTNSFYNVTSIKSLTISSSAVVIEPSAFRGMSGLESITLPFVGRTRVSTGSLGVFGYVFGTSFYTGSYFANGNYIPQTLADVTITDANTIVTNAFYDINSVKSLSVDNSVNAIEISALRGMSGLESISLPFVGLSRIANGSDAYFGKIFGPNLYSNSYISNGNYLPLSLLSVSINDTELIKEDAFNGALEITTIVLPDTLTSIGARAFEEMPKLTSIFIPISVTFIGENAFKNSTSITIYVEALSKPIGWSSSWNPNDRPVIWGHQS